MFARSWIVLIISTLALESRLAVAFLQPTSLPSPAAITSSDQYAFVVGRPSTHVLFAGGFEWEDPGESFDQGVENPFKNPELMKQMDDGMKIDPARLLGPRLGGSNLYMIGMMGSGKSAVGDIVARRKFHQKLLALK